MRENLIISFYRGLLDIQLLRERLSEKSTKVHATRPKGGLGIHWNFAYLPGEMYKGLQVCIFEREEFVLGFPRCKNL